MKKIISLLFIAGVGLMVLMGAGCRKYETEPKDYLNVGIVFDSVDQNATFAGFELNSVYTNLPNGFDQISGDFLDDGAGEAVPSRYNTPVANYYRGTVSVTNNPDPYWANSYTGIRRTNVFLKNIDRVPTVTGTVLNKRYWKAEARWLRAFFYWELLKRYGGVPLLGDTLLTLDSDIRLPRNTFAQTADYIVNECTAVKDSLRSDPLASGDFGRVSKAAAVALKMRVLLYAASPLYNGGGFESDATKKALTGYPSYDATRWQRVIDAYTEFTTTSPYFALTTSGTPTAFTAIFLNRQTTEMIFSQQIAGNYSLEISQSPVSYVVANNRSLGYTSPTQNFVDSFPMLSGLSINATGSGYSANNPYLNRDPRLAATVFYNGSRWLNDTVRTFEGGKDKPNNAGVAPIQTRTGYYLRKFLGNFANSTSYATNQTRNFPYFRYAEIVLNYAEALNEVGRVEDAVTQIIRLRARAGITAGTPARYGIKSGISQADMRSLIQNERRIELAFEEHRFWDIRRWKIAPQVLGNTVLNGVKIMGTGTAATYQTVPVANAYWYDRLYHMPIPYDEITKNTNLIQNEGW